MAEVLASGFADFDRLVLLYRRTLQVLDELWLTGDLPAGGSEVLATQTLPHVEDMETGFRIWLRASQSDLAELRAMVARAGVAPQPATSAERRAALIEAMQAAAGRGSAQQIQPAPANSLAALELARLVFAMLPATPATEVHYPLGRRTYADITPPRRPSELVERIEELESSLWRVATGSAPRLGDARYRRTYGFFDAAVRLVGRGFMLD
ncbi:MAG TPA: hypothetical protein VM305_09380 [Candidatus Limnocylindrales bacterium]|nr:hypothetical protein [Candidatus Limnocylindrales bacterium]